MMASTLIRELRHGFRALSRKPGFSLVVVATLALAIGASTIIYGIVHGVLLAALPYPEPERLVGVWQVGKNGGQGQFSDPNFEDWRARLSKDPWKAIFTTQQTIRPDALKSVA